MRILSITLKQSKTKRLDLLDWLTSVEVNAGVNHSRYWLLNTDIRIGNPRNEYDISLLSGLLRLCNTHNFNQLMIIKNE